MSQDGKLKHLQMIQDVVKRMAETSTAMKRYAVAAFAATATVARVWKEPDVMVLTIVVVLVFWALDAQYLRQEKWFRDMYDDVRKKDEGAIDFDLKPSDDIRNKTGFGYGFDNWSTRWLYGSLLVISLILWLSFYIFSTTGSK